MLGKGRWWWVRLEGHMEASLVKKVRRKRAERLAGVQQREASTRGFQGTARSTVWQGAGCCVDGGDGGGRPGSGHRQPSPLHEGSDLCPRSGAW